MLPPDPCAAHFGWIRLHYLGCSKPWENIIPNLVVFIIFKSRPKFGILGTIDTLILLEIHDYIISLLTSTIIFKFYHPDNSENPIPTTFRVCQSRLKSLLSSIFCQLFILSAFLGCKILLKHL